MRILLSILVIWYICTKRVLQCFKNAKENVTSIVVIFTALAFLCFLFLHLYFLCNLFSMEKKTNRMNISTYDWFYLWLLSLYLTYFPTWLYGLCKRTLLLNCRGRYYFGCNLHVIIPVDISFGLICNGINIIQNY